MLGGLRELTEDWNPIELEPAYVLDLVDRKLVPEHEDLELHRAIGAGRRAPLSEVETRSGSAAGGERPADEQRLERQPRPQRDGAARDLVAIGV